jgi:ligand-binding SRPBCC domain-containing protein
MPVFERAMFFPRPLAEVFDFFCRPANLVTISPPELHMQLIDGPERIELGSRVTLKGRRWGLPQTMITEIRLFEPGVKFMDAMVQGPFRKWDHLHSFASVEDGTRLSDHIEYEPPGGLLGLIATPSLVERELERLFVYRFDKLRELLGARAIP